MEFMTVLQGGLDEQKPSLFEILSENELAALVPPSLRYLLAVATHRNPRYLLRILNNFDEIYALLSLAVERYYLKTYGGGFTENFYGLKRERVLRIKDGESPRARLGAPNDLRQTLRLRNGDIWKNLAVMVGLPYLKRKLDESYDVYAAGLNMLGPTYRSREAYPVAGTWRQKLMWYYKWLLRNLYPSFNAVYWFAMLAFNLAYLFDGTKYHSPFMMLIGSRIRRLNAADSKAIELATTSPAAIEGARPGQSISIFHPRMVTQALYPQLLSGLKLLLPTSIFALKFLEWWHNSDFARQLSRKTNEGLELPPPIISGPNFALAKADDHTAGLDEVSEKTVSPQVPGTDRLPISSLTHLPILTVRAPVQSSDVFENTTSLCPICLSGVQTATAAQTGYVYCYSCIYKWVDGTHPRQEAFMEGTGEEEATRGWVQEGGGSRVGKWESGAGRDPVTGRRVLGGISGLRRVMV